MDKVQKWGWVLLVKSCRYDPPAYADDQTADHLSSRHPVQVVPERRLVTASITTHRQQTWIERYRQRHAHKGHNKRIDLDQLTRQNSRHTFLTASGVSA